MSRKISLNVNPAGLFLKNTSNVKNEIKTKTTAGQPSYSDYETKSYSRILIFSIVVIVLATVLASSTRKILRQKRRLKSKNANQPLRQTMPLTTAPGTPNQPHMNPCLTLKELQSPLSSSKLPGDTARDFLLMMTAVLLPTIMWWNCPRTWKPES